jgi:cytochrome c peroxidase
MTTCGEAIMSHGFLARMNGLWWAWLLVAWVPATQATPAFTQEERQAILSHGPWPLKRENDVSNHVSGQPAEMALGRALFFEARLSPRADMSCASCHQPAQGLTDGLPLAKGAIGQAPLVRNTPSLWNVAHTYWLGWDGGSDSLWSFALRPLLSPQEMGATARHVADLLRSDDALARKYQRAFGVSRQAPSPPHDTDEARLVNAAKALAAYMETLRSGKSSFDVLRDALARNDAQAAARYPSAARRGLSIFMGKGRCSVCHVGPMFSNGEFHDIGVPFFVAHGQVDAGRHAGVRLVREDAHNRLGIWSDDATRTSGERTRHLTEHHSQFGQFKVPSLRTVALTAPYMHNGSLATLQDVVRHYSALNEERLHQDGEALLKPLHLSTQEMDDLVAFLHTLTSLELSQPKAFDRPKRPASYR